MKITLIIHTQLPMTRERPGQGSKIINLLIGGEKVEPPWCFLHVPNIKGKENPCKGVGILTFCIIGTLLE